MCEKKGLNMIQSFAFEGYLSSGDTSPAVWCKVFERAIETSFRV